MSSKENLKEKMKKKRAALAASGQKGNVLYIEEGTIRIRILPTKDGDFSSEVDHVYLNKELKGVFQASTIGEPCPLDEKYKELKKSKDEDDHELAKKLSPRKAYLIPVVVYEDEKGKKIDKDKSGKLMKIPKGVYEKLLDLYLDDDEWGDMTDIKNGYDVKITRIGKTQNDTNYDCSPCKNTLLDKKYAKEVDLDKMVKALFEPYDVVKAKVDAFLGTDEDDSKKSKKDKKKDKGGKAKDDFKSSTKEDKKPEKGKISKDSKKDKKKSKK